ncbi:CoA pyrophosphatase [Oharaeibacter diazotrophicus]|uniref:8-oxo-dGTP pyrophosphatase MutT (NUDIX family) n=1 Tax=Oharaeibacter diazotrophicus TaxID=1920512 RepID=A0A4R6RBN3_9HYPH|nr:CoA pyrophosphatase [Oharaeibacter diazotrophicus]TDP83553.1 8-oxo-dGTP pyrophosphatase MutT (NUDIX family) [Oharaeibacter diazotrophicus]BBE72386.1 putative NUDIX hydrolase [Pleomorphomonas sp. SM30]GLS79157.1 coenzyme A pyrophosphatase [Oharaeibacter diazotrophicus]
MSGDLDAFTAAGVRARRDRLHGLAARDLAPRFHAGDAAIDPSLSEFMAGLTLRDAAVLIGLFERAEGVSLLLTRRTDQLRSHAGQIALPGGKIDPTDDGPVAAALREAEEEVGLDRRLVHPLGLLDPYVSNSGYRIFPVVAFVEADAPLEPNPDEVADVFEVPLAFLMTPTNHLIESRPWRGAERRYYAMPFEGRRIWGVTAGILRLFYEQVFA